MIDPRRNPFPVYRYGTEPDWAGDEVIGWKWYDETGNECEKLYKSQEAALRDMLNYIYWLNHGPTLWQRVWWPIRYKLWPLLVSFWCDQGHAASKPRVKKL